MQDIGHICFNLSSSILSHICAMQVSRSKMLTPGTKPFSYYDMQLMKSATLTIIQLHLITPLYNTVLIHVAKATLFGSPSTICLRSTGQNLP